MSMALMRQAIAVGLAAGADPTPTRSSLIQKAKHGFALDHSYISYNLLTSSGYQHPCTYSLRQQNSPSTKASQQSESTTAPPARTGRGPGSRTHHPGPGSDCWKHRASRCLGLSEEAGQLRPELFPEGDAQVVDGRRRAGTPPTRNRNTPTKKQQSALCSNDQQRVPAPNAFHQAPSRKPCPSFWTTTKDRLNSATAAAGKAFTPANSGSKTNPTQPRLPSSRIQLNNSGPSRAGDQRLSPTKLDQAPTAGNTAPAAAPYSTCITRTLVSGTGLVGRGGRRGQRTGGRRAEHHLHALSQTDTPLQTTDRVFPSTGTCPWTFSCSKLGSLCLDHPQRVAHHLVSSGCKHRCMHALRQ